MVTADTTKLKQLRLRARIRVPLLVIACTSHNGAYRDLLNFIINIKCSHIYETQYVLFLEQRVYDFDWPPSTATLLVEIS